MSRARTAWLHAGRSALRAVCLVLALAAPGLAASQAGGMASDVLDSFTKSPAARQNAARSAPSAKNGPTAPTQPKAPAMPGASGAAQPSAPRQAPLSGHMPVQQAVPGALPRQQILRLNLDGGERQAILVPPRAAPRAKGQPAPKSPLIIFLHGAGGSAAQAMRQTGLAERAAGAGFLAVFPEGLGPAEAGGDGQTWNAWTCCGYARDHRVDDVGFLSALIARLRTDFNADPRRVYLAGFSNGAMLASRFVLERPGVAAALASVAGYLPCDVDRPGVALPVLVLHGDRDAVARFGPTAAHPATGRYCEDYPARAQVDFWVRGMGLDAKARVQDGRKSPLRMEEYGPGKKGGRGLVRFVIVKGGGHAWCGGARERFRYCDLPVSGVDATGLLLDFFRRQPGAAVSREPAKSAAPARRKARVSG